MKYFNYHKNFYSRFLFFLFVFFAISNNMHSQEILDGEVKAGYIFNLPLFTKWPDYVANSPIKIGVYGNNPYGAALDKLKQIKKDEGENWIVEYDIKVDEVEDYHIIIVNVVDNMEFIKLLNATGGKPIITITDRCDSFCKMGGILNFLQQGSNKPFEINDVAARSSHLIFSSNLLRLAKIVVE
jgi:hypothetical protein